MNSRRLSSDERAFSETFAVGALVGITLLMTLSVGVYVLAVGVEDEGTTAEFEYDYDGDADALLVRYAEGEEYRADRIVLEDDTTQATWADLARLGPNETMAPEDAIQLSRNGLWGRPVTGATELDVYHVEGGNRTQLSNWTASP